MFDFRLLIYAENNFQFIKIIKGVPLPIYLNPNQRSFYIIANLIFYFKRTRWLFKIGL